MADRQQETSARVDGKQRRGRPPCFLLWAMLPLSWLLAGYYAYEHTHNSQDYDGSLYTGQVIGKRYTSVWWIERPQYLIRVADRDLQVLATLSMDAIDGLPDRVTFYYSGDTAEEVYLQEETSALAVSLLFFLGVPLGLWLCTLHRRMVLNRLSQ